MSPDNNQITKVEQLIQKGRAVLATHRPNPPRMIGFTTLDSEAFAEWQAQSLSFLKALLGLDHTYVETFAKQVECAYQSSAKSGIGILTAVREDLVAGTLGQAAAVINPLLTIEKLCSRLHAVARQLRSRHQNRETLNVQDEYDVQDLLHALLWIEFEDIRAEEATPSYAAKSSRMDFLLKREKIVVEVKRTRSGLGAKEIASQLIEDIARYKAHPDCKALVCFVYDPEGLVANPRGIEADLSREEGPFPVRVLIRPA